MPDKKDVIHLTVSDFHSGSNYALFLNRYWEGRKGATHAANSGQVRIRTQFETAAAEVKAARKGKKVILVHNGDAIDGDHHASGDVCTLNELEQADIHVELMSELQKRIGWQAGDELYYTRGTETHVHEYENYIGKELNAVMCGDYWVHDLLEITTHGARLWWVHHGPKAGNGANEGNPIRNWLKTIYFDAQKDQVQWPDVVYTGHVHQPGYDAYVYRQGMRYRMMHGIITPSWQMKTSYAWQKAPVNRNKIGGVWQVIQADGLIGVPQFSVL